MSKIVCRPIRDTQEQRECFEIRKQVFVEEQKLFTGSDRDAYDQTAIHIAALIENKIIGTVRIYREKKDIWMGGRLAVRKAYRGKAGKLLVSAAVQFVKQQHASRFKALIQAENVLFFQKLKWKSIGSPVNHRGQPHQMMEAPL